MRTVLLWPAGLVFIAGCGTLPFYRERPAEPVTAKKIDSVPVTTTYEDISRGRIVAPNLPKVNDAPWPTAPTTADAANPATVPPPRIIELSADGRIELTDVALIPEIARKIELSPDAPAAIPAVKESVVANGQVGVMNQHQSIVGQVQQFRKTWRLRYAAFGQDDPYGGSVVLEGADMDRLRDGQRIRVQGLLIAPIDRSSPARYRVQSLEILE